MAAEAPAELAVAEAPVTSPAIVGPSAELVNDEGNDQARGARPSSSSQKAKVKPASAAGAAAWPESPRAKSTG